MGLNPSFSRFVKHMLRNSPKVSYIEHLLSSSSALKKNEVLMNLRWGGKRERKPIHVLLTTHIFDVLHIDPHLYMSMAMFLI